MTPKELEDFNKLLRDIRHLQDRQNTIMGLLRELDNDIADSRVRVLQVCHPEKRTA